MAERSMITRPVGIPTPSENSHYKPISDDQEFCTQILQSTLQHLPTTIYINEHVDGYSIRDGYGIAIWRGCFCRRINAR